MRDNWIEIKPCGKVAIYFWVEVKFSVSFGRMTHEGIAFFMIRNKSTMSTRIPLFVFFRLRLANNWWKLCFSNLQQFVNLRRSDFCTKIHHRLSWKSWRWWRRFRHGQVGQGGGAKIAVRCTAGLLDQTNRRTSKLVGSKSLNRWVGTWQLLDPSLSNTAASTKRCDKDRIGSKTTKFGRHQQIPL